jgi:hypothetical protein
VVADSEYTFVMVPAILAALATGAAAVGFGLRPERGRWWSSVALTVAVCIGLVLAVMWLPVA